MAVKSLKRSTLESTYASDNSLNAGYSFQDFHHLETISLGGTAASVSFINLDRYAGEYKHLQLRIIAQGTTANDNADLYFNNDTGSNYSWHSLYGTGSSVGTDNSINRAGIPETPPLGSSGNSIFSTAIVDIFDAFSTTKFKTIKHLTGRISTGYVSLDSGNWRSTNAITSIKIQGRSYNMNTGSRFSLYGIR